MSKSVFLHYDRQSLDREYDNRSKVADFADYLMRYRDNSAKARQARNGYLDVAFGSSAAETLDIFPAADERAPIQVFIHGGYWKMLHKDDFSYVADAFVPAGATAVVINYALIPEVSMDELVRQCRAALAWVWRNASSFHADPDSIYVSGHSAGGHLAALMMATDWPAFKPELPADLIKGVCGISGLYDLEPIRLCFLNDDLNLTPEQAARNSPVHLPRRCFGPLLLAVGALEGPEYLRQTQDLAAAWQTEGEAPDVMVMDDIHHFSIVSQFEDSASPLSRAIQRQMGLI